MRRLKSCGVKYSFIVDSVFNTNREHVEQVCETLIRADLDMEWGCFLRPRAIGRDQLELMKRAGLRHIEFGSDSLSDAALKRYGKGFTWEDVRTTSLHAHELGLNYSHFLIFGGPGETEETVEETIAHASLFPDATYFGMIGMRIYPGTELWMQLGLENKGELPGEYLVEPRFHVEPPLSVDGLSRRLREVSAVAKNWMIGDPPPAFKKMIASLREKGARGPMWEYVELSQRFTKTGGAA
jgi:radical SAM superfamily enzyme YgiQ (UPF0313 family)